MPVASCSTTAAQQERSRAPDVVDHEAEVLAEKAGDVAERQEDRCDDRQLLHDLVHPVRGAREEDVHRGESELMKVVDRLRKPVEVVGDVAEITSALRVEPRDLVAIQVGEHVALRRDRPAQRRKPALHREEPLKRLVARGPEEVGLELVQLHIEALENRKEAVDEAVDDAVQGERRIPEIDAVGRAALLELVKGGSVVSVDGDQKALRVEAVHLDQAVIVRRPPVDDEEDVVVVGLELRPLAEILRVLDRQWMELERLAEDLEVRIVRLLDVEPEELVRT